VVSLADGIAGVRASDAAERNASTCAVAIESNDAWWIQADAMTCQTYNEIEEPELAMTHVGHTRPVFGCHDPRGHTRPVFGWP